MRVDNEADTLRRCQEVVERQSRHMARLLDDLLDVSRVTRGRFELRKSDVDLQEAVAAAIEGTAPRLAERRISLVVGGTKDPLPVRGDLTRLQQVVANLLVNAGIYSPAGSEVRLETETVDERAVVRVIDHGMGIEPEMLETIFELFVQAEQPLDRSLGGLGVGLSLARSIVELHGGTIRAHSDGHDRGATFEVAIPLQRRPVQRWRRDTVPAPRACRIVLVEDQADERDMLRMLLERRDHVVIDAADGPSAVQKILHEHPDIALIDIGLPHMNGYEVAQQIRSREELDDVVLVALTGYGAPNDLVAARDAGFDDHLIKPADVSRIEELLARYRPVTDSGS
jgi:two-component system CheB/CheR fusion protein